jgi:ADP-ribose pyrophosphatase YjhB (NUDIX family)
MTGYLSEKDYNFIYSRSPRVCVDLIIKTQTGVLLIKREIQPYKGKYHLPGGRIRFRESVHKAIFRICKNEVSLVPYCYKLLGFMEFPREQQDRNKRHSISLAFLVECKGVRDVKPLKKQQIHPVHYKFLKSHKLI